MLDLFARTWQDEQFGDDEYVIGADEKTSVQARCRCHPILAPAGPGRSASITPMDAAAPWPTSLPSLLAVRSPADGWGGAENPATRWRAAF
ncbi:hypothetical protein [Streptomyces sp. LN245]|uniref:hypothetical protein n=1 Tax=Streptomyces sp. LN245 TaxID=3112975 RepID=UPI00371E63C8